MTKKKHNPNGNILKAADGVMRPSLLFLLFISSIHNFYNCCILYYRIKNSRRTANRSGQDGLLTIDRSSVTDKMRSREEEILCIENIDVPFLVVRHEN